MIAVIFEVVPAENQKQAYLDLAADLATHLKSIPGFISVERFTSISNPKKMLSLSFWENEAAVAQWRAIDQHRAAQRSGREHVFENYRLRVAQVVRDYGLNERDQVPKDSKEIHG